MLPTTDLVGNTEIVNFPKLFRGPTHSDGSASTAGPERWVRVRVAADSVLPTRSFMQRFDRAQIADRGRCESPQCGAPGLVQQSDEVWLPGMRRCSRCPYSSPEGEVVQSSKLATDRCTHSSVASPGQSGRRASEGGVSRRILGYRCHRLHRGRRLDSVDASPLGHPGQMAYEWSVGRQVVRPRVTRATGGPYGLGRQCPAPRLPRWFDLTVARSG